MPAGDVRRRSRHRRVSAWRSTLETPSLGRARPAPARVPRWSLAAVVAIAARRRRSRPGAPGRARARRDRRPAPGRSRPPAFEALSFAGYIALTRARRRGASAGRQLPHHPRRRRRHPPAADGGCRRRRADPVGAQAPRAHARHDLLTFLVVLYAVFLAALLGGRAPGRRRSGPPRSPPPPRWPPAPFVPEARPAAVRSRSAPRGCARPASERLLGAPAWWAFDCAVLWATFHAVGAPPRRSPSLVLGYFLGQVANTMPLPGAASSGMIGVFVAFGVAPELAARRRARLPRHRDLAAGPRRRPRAGLAQALPRRCHSQ